MTDVWLGLETTTSTGGIALVSGGRLLAEEFLSVVAQHSEQVLPGISSLLERTGIPSERIEGIAVSSGPGSYTGLRIGLATASGLACGLGAGLKGVETLRVLAVSVNSEYPVLACIRARTEEVFAVLYKDSSPDSIELIPPGIYTAASLERELTTGGKIIAVGSGRSELSLKPSVRWVPPLWDYPRPSVVAYLGILKTQEEGFDEAVTPVYLRGFSEKAKNLVR